MSRTSSSHTSNPRVFAVEDNPADVRLMREGVKTTGIEIELTVFTTGSVAVEEFSALNPDTPAEHPDLILLDLNLSNRSGFDLLEFVRTESAFQDAPVVIVSASEEPADIDQSYELAAYGYIKKPIDPDEHIRIIGATVDFWVETDTSIE